MQKFIIFMLSSLALQLSTLTFSATEGGEKKQDVKKADFTKPAFTYAISYNLYPFESRQDTFILRRVFRF